MGVNENRVGFWTACRHLRAVQVRLQVPPLRSPDFLSSLVTLANFVRLS